MQKLVKAFEEMMVAITFAEAGEYDEARKITGNEQEIEAVDMRPITKAAVKS